MTPARFKIFQELRNIRRILTAFNESLLTVLNESCWPPDYNNNNINKNVRNNAFDMLLTVNMFQLILMIGLLVALMCNFYALKEPKWKEVAWKAVAFGLIVTFWPIYVMGVLFSSFYFKCVKPDEIKAEVLAKAPLSSGGALGGQSLTPSLTPMSSPAFKRKLNTSVISKRVKASV